MSKELDKVNEIQHAKAIYKADGTTVIESSWFNLLVAYAKEALQRLEAIDNIEPNEALKELKRIDCNITYLLSDCDINEEVDMNFTSIKEHKSCEVIKQALLKNQVFSEILNKYDVEDLDELNTILSNYRKHW